MEWREHDGVRWLRADLPGAVAAFSTRPGGVSEGPYESLNLGLWTGDDADSVHRNRELLAGALGIDPAKVLMGFQVHKADVARVTEPLDPSPYVTPPDEPLEFDGHATATEGLVPLVLVADCLPVALRGNRGVAMLHCGWRGLAEGIVARGAAEVDATAAAIGPGIGPCCYEVGPEVLARFDRLGPGIAGGGKLDLPEVATRMLAAAGVERIERSELCTSCERELFFSHRRDGGVTGRQAGAVWLT
jgi:hypothetical protein